MCDYILNNAILNIKKATDRIILYIYIYISAFCSVQNIKYNYSP